MINRHLPGHLLVVRIIGLVVAVVDRPLSLRDAVEELLELGLARLAVGVEEVRLGKHAVVRAGQFLQENVWLKPFYVHLGASASTLSRAFLTCSTSRWAD